MHELSIACDLVDLVESNARAAGALSVSVVHLRLGALAGVEVESLRVGFATAVEGTLLAGARLEVEEVAVQGWCPQCATECAPIDVQWLACPICYGPLTHLTGGREIEIAALEIVVPDETPTPAASAA